MVAPGQKIFCLMPGQKMFCLMPGQKMFCPYGAVHRKMVY